MALSLQHRESKMTHDQRWVWGPELGCVCHTHSCSMLPALPCAGTKQRLWGCAAGGHAELLGVGSDRHCSCCAPRGAERWLRCVPNSNPAPLRSCLAPRPGTRAGRSGFNAAPKQSSLAVPKAEERTSPELRALCRTRPPEGAETQRPPQRRRPRAWGHRVGHRAVRCCKWRAQILRPERCSECALCDVA